MKNNHFFITATDTEVGKTTFCQFFIIEFLKSNQNNPKITYIKPYQTGIQNNKNQSSSSLSSLHLSDFYCKSDSSRILETNINPKNIHEISCYRLPAAPYHASLFDNNPIDEQVYQKNLTQIQNILAKNSHALIEGSGGILVPITQDKMILDLIKELQIPVILIAKQGLGTLNHTLLSIKILLKNQIKIKAIFLNEFFASKNPQINQYNYQFLKQKTPIPLFKFSEIKQFISKIEK